MTKVSRTRLLRPRADRDARLFLVGVEGAVTEPLYFQSLEARGVFHERIRLRILPTERGESAPDAVLARVDAERRALDELRDMDECWLVVDRDQWEDKMLAAVAAACEQKRYGLAVSNPCFEVWLLLHHGDASGVETSAHAATALKSADPSYSSRSKQFDAERYTHERVTQAIERARALDTAPTDRWPSRPPATRMYRLATSLLRDGR